MESLVTVIMPFYNAERFMRLALDSIIAQNYQAIEILCINDGSSDKTGEILEEYRRKDKRIIVVTNIKNCGLIASLNSALELVNGKLFARMDADDYSAPDRISKLVAYLKENPEINLVSSGYYYFKKDGKLLNMVSPIALSPEALKILSLFATPLAHAAICGRTKLIKEKLFYYDSNYVHAEDFELFSRLAWNHIKMANINQPLYSVRLHTGSVSFKHNVAQTESNLAIVNRNLNIYLNNTIVYSRKELKVLVCRIDEVIGFKTLVGGIKLFNQIIDNLVKQLPAASKREVVAFANKHTLNIIIQSNKQQLKSLKLKSILYLVRSLLLIKPAQYRLLFFKLFKG